MSERNNMQDNEMAMEALRWFVQDVYQNKIEADKDCETAAQEDKDFKSGRSLAYFEVWDMLVSRLDILNIQIDLPNDGIEK